MTNAAAYGVGAILIRFGSFLLLPLYWHKLVPADFGISGLAELVMVLLIPLLSFGLPDAVLRFYYEWKGDARERSITTLWLIQVVGSGAICVALDIAGPYLFPMILKSIPFDPYLRIAIWTSFFGNLSLFPFAVMRMREKIKWYNACLVSCFLLETIARVALVLNGWGATGYLLGTLFANVVMGVFYLAYMLRSARKPSFSRAVLADSFSYSLPLMATATLEGVNATTDRYFLDKFVPVGQIGLYSLGNQLGFAYSFFNAAMKASWSPFLFRSLSERNDTPQILARFSVYYIALLSVPGLAIAVLAPEVITLLGTERFAGVAPFVPCFVLIYLVQSSATALGRGADLAKKMVPTIWPLILTLVTSVLAGWLLIPVWGVWGAVAAGFISASVRSASLCAISMYHYPRPTPWRKLFGVIAVMLLAMAASASLPTTHPWITLPLKLVALACYPIVIAYVLFSRDQIRQALEMVRRRIKRSPEAS